MATDPMTIRLSRFAAGDPIFFGNESGRAVFQKLQKELEAAPEIDVFGISLDGVRATDASFPRESVVSLAKMLRGEKGFYLEGFVNNDLLDNWDYAAKAKDQNIIVKQGEKKYRVIGPELHESMKALLDFVMREGQVTTAKVAKKFDISVQNASARMKRLHQAGLVLGSKESAETGGLEYLFRAIQ
jgi:hypothetical protein